MIATLQFDLDEPGQRDAHYTAVNGWRYRLLLNDFLLEIRQVTKYDAKFCKLKPAQCEAIREWFANQLREDSLEWP